MIDTHPLGWYTISGNRRVATVSAEAVGPGPSTGDDLLHQEVVLDGVHYRVMGVEHCLVNHFYSNERCPKGYGLMVEEIEQGSVR